MSENTLIRTLKMPLSMNFLAPTIVEDLVRIGRHNDGGYIVPRFIISETEVLISLGLSDDWSFEADFLSQRPNLKIHAYDHTVSMRGFIKKALGEIARFFFRKSHLKKIQSSTRVIFSYRSFFKDPTKHYRERVHNRRDENSDATFDVIFDRLEPKARVFVKMDIEGSEYRVIPDLLRYSDSVIGMVIEFHDLDPLRKIFICSLHDLCEKYEIVHVHANNNAAYSTDNVPEVLEITFVKKQYCSQLSRRTKLPLRDLDEPNDVTRADYSLEFNL